MTDAPRLEKAVHCSMCGAEFLETMAGLAFNMGAGPEFWGMCCIAYPQS